VYGEGKRRGQFTIHAGNREAQRLREMAEREFENIEVAFISIINDVVGSITGPNTLTFAWCEI